jgi:hypothetical protein
MSLGGLPTAPVAKDGLTETPKEILYAAVHAERISEYILCIEEKQKTGDR